MESLSPGPLRLLPTSEPRRGRYEMHYLKGWPDGEGKGLIKCSEHGETCGMKVHHLDGFMIVRKVLVEDGFVVDLG